MNPLSDLRRLTGSGRLLILLSVSALVLLAVLWATVFYRLSVEKQTALRQAGSHSEALVQAFEERSNRILHQIDQSSRFIQFVYEKAGTRSKLADFASNKALLPNDAELAISITNSAGELVDSNQPGVRGSVVGREYFEVLRNQAGDSLFISQAELDPESGKSTIVLSRRLNRPDGSFAGIVLFTVGQEFLGSLPSSSALGQMGFIGLIGNDGVFRARQIGDRATLAKKSANPGIDYSAWLRSIRNSSATGVSSDNPFDRVRRVYSAHQLALFPMTVIVGIAEEEALAAYVGHRLVYFLSGLAGSVAILAFMALLMLQSRELRRRELAAEAARSEFSAAADGSLNAFYILKSVRAPDRRIVDFVFADINESGARLLGISRQEAIGEKLSTLMPNGQGDAFFRRYSRAVALGARMEEEFEISTPGIRARWLHHQIVPVGDGLAITTRNISERKYHELETRSNRAFLQSLIDYLPVLVYAKSMREENRGCIVVWNKAAESITGYAVNTVIGKTNRGAFSGQMVEQFDEFDRQMCAEPKVTDMPEVPCRRADGELRYLHMTTWPLFDKDNRVEYILGVAEDITGRRAQEHELRTQQAELLAVNDASPLGLFRTGPDGDCTYVNRAYELMSGLTRAQALGDGWAKSIHPEDRLKVFQGWGKSSKAHQLFQGVYRFRHPDGRIVWASMKTAPIIVDGVTQGHVGTVDDITTRRESEQALFKSEQRLRTITDALPAMVAYIDADERFRVTNLAYERAYGVGRNAITHKTLREFLGEAEYSVIQPYVQRVLHGESLSFENDQGAEDDYRCIESTYIPQFGADGKEVIGFHVMIQDITAQKTEERRLLQLAQVDSLTGLINRAGFEQKLGEAMAHAREANALMALMYLDIDHFKSINDSLGHMVGDMMLKAFAARLSRTLRAADTVARLGGDEFVVIMEDVTLVDDVENIVAKIVKSMRALFSLEGHPVSASVSIGVAFYQGEAIDAKKLVRQADEMLYLAKAEGRNTYSIAPFNKSSSVARF